MADLYPPGTAYDLVRLLETGKIESSDKWIHMRIPMDRSVPLCWVILTGDEQKTVAAALPKPVPSGNSATVNTARLNARATPGTSGVILTELSLGQQVVLGDSAPVIVNGLEWLFIIWPVRAWCAGKYLTRAIVQPPPPPVLTGDMGVCVVASGDGSDERQLGALVAGLREKGKVLASACVVQNAGLANALKGMSPQTFLIYRYIHMIRNFDGQIEEVNPGHPLINYNAQKMWDLGWPEAAKVPNADCYQIGDNESDPENIEDFRKWCTYVSDMIDIADAHPAKPRLALFNFGVGHPKYEVPEFKAALDPVLRKAAKRHFINVHIYSPTVDKNPSGPVDIEASWEWFAGRIERLMDAVPDGLFIATEYGLADGRYPGREIYQANVGKFRGRMQARRRFVCFNVWMIPEKPNDPDGVWKWQGHGVPVADFIEIA